MTATAQGHFNIIKRRRIVRGRFHFFQVAPPASGLRKVFRKVVADAALGDKRLNVPAVVKSYRADITVKTNQVRPDVLFCCDAQGYNQKQSRPNRL